MNPFAVLARQRNFRLFWIGQTISLVGSWMQSMAQGWLALDLTDNAFLVGLVVAAGSLPVVLLSFHAGVMVDRYERLKLVKLCQWLFVVDAGLIFAFTITGHITIEGLLLLATIHGLISAIEIPARQSLIVELAGREYLPQAIALNSSGFNLARIVGPALGALIIAKFGIAWSFAVRPISLLAVIIGLSMVRLEAWKPAARLPRPSGAIRENMTYMRETPLVAALMKLVTVYSILGVPYLVLMPVFARDRLGLGASGYGLLLASVGIGGLMGALAVAAQPGPQAGKRTMLVATLSFPALLLVLSTITRPTFAYPLLFLAGIAMIVNSAVTNSMLQHLVPDVMRGRLMAAYSFVVVGLSQTIGAFVAGLVARAFGVQWAIAIGAVIMLGYAIRAFTRAPLKELVTPAPAAP